MIVECIFKIVVNIYVWLIDKLNIVWKWMCYRSIDKLWKCIFFFWGEVKVFVNVLFYNKRVFGFELNCLEIGDFERFIEFECMDIN